MTDVNAATVRPQYFLEQVRRFGAQWASERYKVLDPRTLRELSFKEKLIFAGAILWLKSGASEIFLLL